MDTIGSKLEETTRHVARQRDAIVDFVRAESAGWQRFASRRAASVRSDIVSTLSARGIERRMLGAVDTVLRALDGKVRARLASLDGAKPRKRRAGASKNGRVKSAKAALPPTALAGAARH